MWPFERWRSADVLRVCRGSVEHWVRQHAGLVLEQREILERPMDAAALEDAIARLFAGASGRRVVDIILESAWLPVMLLAPSSRQRKVADLEALLRERLMALPDSAEAASQWQIQIDGLPGDAHVCGYALPVRLREGLTRTLRDVGAKVRSLQPALAWARTQHSQRATRRHSGWWLWQESDRTLLVGLRRGHMQSLHPALPPMTEHFAPQTAVDCEAARTGLPAREPMLVGGWLAPAGLVTATAWQGVAATLETAPRSMAPAAGVSMSSSQNPARP